MMTTTTTANLKAEGYTCRRTTIEGQGYFGGDGCGCYRVYAPDGSLYTSRVSTYARACDAWREAATRYRMEH